jgi:4-aminobutyrate aminotransferase-like enzyme
MSKRTGSPLIELRQRLLGKAYRWFYDQPLHIVRGEGAWLFDADGRRYLDAYNNVPHVGHCHPKVVEAISRQAAVLNTHTRYLHETVLDYAERLLSHMPAGLDTAMFACTGTEANELAIRIARAVTGADGVIAVDYAYHGNSTLMAQLSPSDRPVESQDDRVEIVACPDLYRGEFRGEDAGQRYAESVDRGIEALSARGHGVAAFIIDTNLSSNGQPRIPPDWLPLVIDRLHAAGALFIADEVQPGFGRLGSHFWGFEKLGVTPDIVTMGKPMANGYPMSGVVTRAAFAETFDQRSRYFNTFGGSPVASAAAMAVLDVIEQEGLQQNALETGRYLCAGFEAFAKRFEAVGEVRGAGLFWGLELVQDRDTREPATAMAHAVIEALRAEGVLVGSAGKHENVIKIRPPMCLSLDQADVLLAGLEKALKKSVGPG